MAGSVGLLAANALFLAIGIGMVGLLGAGGTRPVLARLGLAYIAGVAIVSLLAAQLALVGVGLGPAGLAGLAALSLVFGARRFARLRGPSGPRGMWGGRIVGGAALVQLSLLLGVAASAFAVRPMIDWDGWAIWGSRARALYDFGTVWSTPFQSHVYASHMLDYPLLLPALEAVGFRAIGAADETLIHLQLIGLAAGFAGALWALLRPRVPSEILSLSLLALFAAPAVLESLAMGYADVPLAFFVALGVAAAARWLVEPESGLLPWSALFLAAAALTKNEGALFAAAAFVCLLAVVWVRDRSRLRGVAAAAACAFAPLVPWRIFLAVNGIHNYDLDLGRAIEPSYLVEHASRVAPAVEELGRSLLLGRFGLLVPLAACALVLAPLARRGVAAVFATGWLACSFAGLVVIYWISPRPLGPYLATSADRVVLSLVVTAAALAPFLAGEAWRSVVSDWRSRWPGGVRTGVSPPGRPSPASQQTSEFDLETLRAARRFGDWMFAQFEPYVGRRTVEVGAGIGTFSERLLERGVPDLLLIEPDDVCAGELERRFGGEPSVRIVQETLPGSPTLGVEAGTFDFVLCQNVLEHIEDDGAATAALAGALHPGGALGLLVPAHPRLYGSLDAAYGHHRRYTRERLEDLIRGAGLELVELRAFNLLGVPGWWFKSWCGAARLDRRSLSSYELLLRLWRPLEESLRPPWGLSFVAIARCA